MHVPFVECHMPHVEAMKLIIYSSGKSVLWDQRAITYSLLLNPKIAVMHWSDPKSYNEPFVLSLMHVPFVACHMPHVEAMKLIIYSSGQSMLWDQRAIACSLSLNPKLAVMHWSDPKSDDEPFELLHSQDEYNM